LSLVCLNDENGDGGVLGLDVVDDGLDVGVVVVVDDDDESKMF